MTVGKFHTSLEEAKKLLEKIDLFRQKGIKQINTTGVSNEFKTAAQKADYFQVYKTAKKNFDYDFLLKDESFFQFEFKPRPNPHNCPIVRYAFFQNPQEYKSYREYLIEQEITQVDDNEDDEIFREEYEQFSIEQQFNLSSTTIRFDVDTQNYRPRIHSVAHIHIGHKSNIRIPCDKILTPLMFVVFVLKHAYYNDWKAIIESADTQIMESLNRSKNGAQPLSDSTWKPEEKHEF
jgi:hypothetical protein